VDEPKRIDQSNLVQVKEQFETEQHLRDEEAEWLDAQLGEVEDILEQLEEGWESRKQYSEDRAELKRRTGELPDDNYREFERYYWNVIDRKFRIEQKLHYLVREQRDDLEYIARLEGRQGAKERAERWKQSAEVSEFNGERTTETVRNKPGGSPRTGATRNKPIGNPTTGTVKKNRQHRKRVPKRHDNVSSESSTQN